MSYIRQYLNNIIPVAFELETAEEFHVIGRGPAQFKVTIKKEIPRSELLKSTSLALGEAYMRGDIELNRDLYEVLDSFLGEMGRFKKNKVALRHLIYTSKSRQNQKKEVTTHYDIGNDFYKLWLDETMSYSCAYFKSEHDTLYDAQIQKVDHILDKLQLREGMTLLDIGCGWGFLLKRAVERHGVKGMGITLSVEQYQQFSQDIKEIGFQDQLEVRIMDYRELQQSRLEFDRVVSVGMMEHIGRGNYGTFLENINTVLKPEGVCLLHYISGLKEYSGDPWIKKYIFPGGTIPSLREIINLLPEYRFHTLDVESLRRHYTRTLLCWRENFQNHKDIILEKYGQEFHRMWELYLASCAATFHNGIIDLHQILISKGVNNQLPLIRKV